jgi:dynein heavy chain
VISDLRNPALKQRHWDTIQQVLEHAFSDEEPLTLGLLENIDAFDHSESIQEISGQASSEASLESLLKKVTCWKLTICLLNSCSKLIALEVQYGSSFIDPVLLQEET